MFFPGDRVVCTNLDDIERAYVGIYYPEVGILGTVVSSNRMNTDVHWDEGTTPGSWLIPNKNIALANNSPPEKPFDKEIDDLICSINGVHDV